MRENESVTRVLIADDSEIASEFLEQLLEADAQIRVIGHAATGRELLEHPSRKPRQVVPQRLPLVLLVPDVRALEQWNNEPLRLHKDHLWSADLSFHLNLPAF